MFIKGGACIHKNSHKSKLTLDRNFTRSKDMSMRDVRRMTTREPSLQSNICSMCFCFHSCTAAVCLLPTWLSHHKSHALAKCSCDSTVSLFFCSLASPQADAQRDQSHPQDTHLRLSPFFEHDLLNHMRCWSNLGGPVIGTNPGPGISTQLSIGSTSATNRISTLI